MLSRRRDRNKTACAAPPPPPEEHACELMISILAVAPDVRYRAARQLGVLAGLMGASGPEVERRLLERAYERRMLAALAEAISR